MMKKLTDLYGVGDKTAEILTENGYDIENISEVSYDELIKIGLKNDVSNKILENFKEDDNPENLTSTNANDEDDSKVDDDLEDDEELDYSKRPDLTYSNANKYIRYAFEKSEYYNNGLSESELEREFRKFVNHRL